MSEKPLDKNQIEKKNSALEASKPKQGLSFLDPFGNVILLKRMLTSLLGMATYRRFNIVNKTKVIGAEYLQDLPTTNVLFVSNHQTYFADVMALYHVFSSAKWKLKQISIPIYLLLPRVKTYYIAAEETMKDGGWLPKLFSYAGAVTVRRSWRHKGESVKRGADISAPAKIKKALSFGWVITFPQGTTVHNAPIRKGPASLIKSLAPIVVPVKIEGFNKAFDKRGLRYRKKGVPLSVSFGKPVTFSDETTVADIQSFLENHLLEEEKE
ncbi:MAG: lysophospholipid acyltransferase family protein [Saprospiraceae bacterium]